MDEYASNNIHVSSLSINNTKGDLSGRKTGYEFGDLDVVDVDTYRSGTINTVEYVDIGDRKFNKMYNSCKEKTRSIGSVGNNVGDGDINMIVKSKGKKGNGHFYGSVDSNFIDFKLNSGVNIGEFINNQHPMSKTPTEGMLNKKHIPKLDFHNLSSKKLQNKVNFYRLKPY